MCLLLDSRGRRYLVDLEPGKTFQYHAGSLSHDDVIGSAVATMHRTSAGSRLMALRPRLADYVLKMPRGAQLIYPKDLGPMIHWGDVAPGQLVVEAGTGSGALTLALLRAVGPTGRVVTVERRQDHHDHAAGIIARFLGELPENLEMIVGEAAEVVTETREADRLMLDLPEPWAVVDEAAGVLAPGAIVCTYLPTVPQVRRLTDALRRTGRFTATETFEGLHRPWNIEGRSVRPATQMVGHTGFITVSRHTAAPLRDDDPAAVAGS